MQPQSSGIPVGIDTPLVSQDKPQLNPQPEEDPRQAFTFAPLKDRFAHTLKSIKELQDQDYIIQNSN